MRSHWTSLCAAALVLMLAATAGCGTVYTCKVSDPPPALTKCPDGEPCAAKLVVPCKGDPQAVVVRWPSPVKLQVSPDALSEED